MKKITITILSLIIIQQFANAQDTLWRKGGIATFNVNQTSLTNWAAGGENALAATALLSIYANYKHQRAAWDNSLDLGYGMLKQGDADVRKNEDKIDFTSKYGHCINDQNKLFYTGLVNFKSQFMSGYNYPDDSTVISKFAAPAYITLALGMDYKPTKDFSLFISPLTGKITIVSDKRLADAGAYGVDKASYLFPNDSIKIKDGKQLRFEFGAYLKAMYQKEISKNVNLITKIDLFSNYADKPQNIDVNWEVLITFKINKLLTASISTQLLYDDNIAIQEYKTNAAGVRVPKLHADGTSRIGPRTQFKEVLGIGLAYKFEGYGVKK